MCITFIPEACVWRGAFLLRVHEKLGSRALSSLCARASGAVCLLRADHWSRRCLVLLSPHCEEDICWFISRWSQPRKTDRGAPRGRVCPQPKGEPKFAGENCSWILRTEWTESLVTQKSNQKAVCNCCFCTVYLVNVIWYTSNTAIWVSLFRAVTVSNWSCWMAFSVFAYHV